MPTTKLKIIIPHSPIQTKNLLLTSIQNKNPIIFLKPKILYHSNNKYNTFLFQQTYTKLKK